MKKIILFYLTLLTILPNLLFAANKVVPPLLTKYTVDTDYTAVPTSTQSNQNVKDYYGSQCNTKPTVIEFFSYACPACFSAEPKFQSYMNSKANNVIFKRVPVIFNSGWDIVGKLYYTNERLGLTQYLHNQTFLWVQQQLRERKAITADSIKSFIETVRSDGTLNDTVKAGFTMDEYMDVLNSNTVNRDNKNGMRLLEAYKITSTPSIVVSNKYIITLDKVKSLDAAIDMIKEFDGENTVC